MNEEKKYEFTKEQLADVERMAENRGFVIAIKAMSIFARQLLGPQHKVIQLIDALKGN